MPYIVSYNNYMMNPIYKNKIIVIVGPTASGKSDLALRLAKLAQGKLFQKKYHTTGAEIISADSRQVYRSMDIGTGKVKKKEQANIKHHLIDVASPKRQFTVARYKKMGQKVISEVMKKRKTPIIVGGTGFYIDALLNRIDIPDIKPNLQLRRRLGKLDTEHLFKMLQKLDPKRAWTIETKNKRRLIRAIEIASSSKSKKRKIKVEKYNDRLKITTVIWIGIKVPQDELNNKIKHRLDQRIQQGMINEVKRLRNEGISWKRLDNFGLEYRWISRYLRGKISRKEMRENLLRDIIKYSKRQMTWWKRNKDIKWFSSTPLSAILRRLED
jgi:tRNA dimethylallyltransferase